MLAGRLPGPGSPGEIAVDQIAAASLHLHVGSTLPMVALPDVGLPGSGDSGGKPSALRKLTERVVGIIVTRASVDPVTDIDKVPFILASTALWHRIGPGYLAFDGAFVKLRAGATVGNVTREAQALARRFPKTEGQVYVADESTQVAADRAVHPPGGSRARDLRGGARLLPRC